ncbi:MAG: hypothetical protein HGB16_02845 [Chlorobaculum sp.]|nr:hypothetical protein [Chlorobaculum sp.]
MPVEIRELHIKVTVNESGGASGQEAGAGRKTGERSADGAGGGADREAIVAECVEEVLRIMQNKRER